MRGEIAVIGLGKSGVAASRAPAARWRARLRVRCRIVRRGARGRDGGARRGRRRRHRGARPRAHRARVARRREPRRSARRAGAEARARGARAGRQRDRGRAPRASRSHGDRRHRHERKDDDDRARRPPAARASASTRSMRATSARRSPRSRWRVARHVDRARDVVVPAARHAGHRAGGRRADEPRPPTTSTGTRRVEEYYADKELLFRNARTISKWVVNGDDRAAIDLAREAVGTHKHFSLKRSDADATYDRASDTLVVGGLPLLPRRELNLFGDHNVANALAASLAVMVADRGTRRPRRARASPTGFARSTRSSTASSRRRGQRRDVDQRLEGDERQLHARRDSGDARPTILLLGGRHKGEPYRALAEPLRKTGKAVIAYGEAAPIIEQDLAGRGAARAARLELRGSDGACARARDAG